MHGVVNSSSQSAPIYAVWRHAKDTNFLPTVACFHCRTAAAILTTTWAPARHLNCTVLHRCQLRRWHTAVVHADCRI